jgi:hypothetical protein
VGRVSQIGKMRNAVILWFENVKEIDHWEDLGVERN